MRSRISPDHIREAVETSLHFDWPGTVAQVMQPSLFIRAVEPFGPPGYPPLVNHDTAVRTVGALADGTLLEVPGNHITCLFGDNAAGVAAAIAESIGRFFKKR